MKQQNKETEHHILIVEDDRPLAGGLCRALQNDGTMTTSCHTLREAEEILGMKRNDLPELSPRDGGEAMGVLSAQVADIDLVVLDVNLPDGNGFDFLKKIKEKCDIRVIMLTANDMETDIVAGLELGADDYVTKPFSLAVLRARVATQLRRVETRGGDGPTDISASLQGEGWIYDGDYRFHFPKMLFYHGEEQIELSKSEQKLLRIFVENRGITLTRDRLLDCIWSVDSAFVDENTLSVTVKRLRDKLGAQERIKTVYGIGYRWE